jgi:hypothetical protein
MYIGLHVTHPLFLSDFDESQIFSTDFRIVLRYQISSKSFQVGAELFRTDRRKDGYDEANSRFLQFCKGA